MQLLKIFSLASIFLLFTSWVIEAEEDKKASDGISVYEQFQRNRTMRGSAARVPVRRALPVAKYEWNADESKPMTRIEVKISEQKLYGYQGEVLVVVSDISSGKPKYETPHGNFKVISKNRHQKSNLYGSFVNEKGQIVDPNAEVGQTPPPGCRYVPSDMPYFLRLTHDGVGFHAGFLPGFAASHGCIRLPEFIAEKLFSLVAVGTPVTVGP